MRNRVFFPQAALDEWLGDDRVDLKNDELSIKGENRRFRIIEAVRVLREVTGSDDPHELLGRVKSCAFLNELGAELLQSSMIIGDNAYDVLQGFVGAPTSTFEDHRKLVPDGKTANDEELLLALIAQKSA
jgi:hypothetical protein